MQYVFWGVRGSLPKPETPSERREQMGRLLRRFEQSQCRSVDEFLKSEPESVVGGFGGHTSCFEARSGGRSLVIDGGSGIKELGLQLTLESHEEANRDIHILMTHFHWDHLIGLPFFVPFFIPDYQVHFYAVQEELEETIRLVFSKPYFPVDFKNLAATVHFHKLSPRMPQSINGFRVTPYRLDHPDPCWGFSIEAEQKKIAHCVDTEATRTSREDLGSDLALYQNVDLMIFDAQYTVNELIEKVNWGHAVAGLGLDLAMREGIKKVAFVHHDPSAEFDRIQEAIRQTQAYYDQQLKESKLLNLQLAPVDWFFAHEGLILEI